MMEKQTAVEWFFSELERMQYFIGNDMLQAYKQAKEMETQIKPITPEALIELGFIDTSYADEGITFTEFTYYHELFEIQVYGDNVVDLKIGGDWQSTNATTIEDIKHLIRLFA